MIDGIPVIDGVIHAYNLDPSNYANRHAGIVSELIVSMVGALSRPKFVARRETYLRDWPMEEVVRLVFTESDTDLAVYHVLPLSAFRDGMCSLEKAVEAKRRWPERIICYCGVDPLRGSAALDDLDRQVEILQPAGLKLYPNSWVGNETKEWRMDNPEVAFPIFERARKRGLKVVAIHKAVPLGPVAMDPYRMDDIDRAAMAFPDLNFEVVHGGMAFLEETAWQLARFPNVFVNLEVTTAYVATRPKLFDGVFSTLMSVAGAGALERVIWGTGAIAFHPQPLLESFVREFQFSEETVARTGVAELTRADKRKILFENFSKMSGIDLGAKLARTVGDEFDMRRAAGRLPPFSAAGRVNV